MSDGATMPELERSLPGLRAAYEAATVAFVDLAEKKTKATEKGRLPALRAWHAAGIALFNAHERLIVLGAVAKADQNTTWFTDRAETSVNLLQTICNHFRTLWMWVSDLSMSRDDFRPSPTAFANIQRLVKETHSEIARSLRAEFVGLGLPTHGFDTADLVKSATVAPVALWERICATVAGAVILLVFVVVILRNEPFSDPNQVVFLRIAISFSVALFGACIPGFLHVRVGRGKNLVRASGALALFIVTYFFTPKVLPPHPRTEPTSSSSKLAEDIDIVDVGFADYSGDARAPRLDIKVANRGTAPAFIKSVKITVKQVWCLPSYTTVGVVVPPSHEYVVHLKPSGTPYEVNLLVSHGLKPDDMDRFTIQIEETSWPTSNAIYRADLEIIANGSNLTYRKANYLFLVTQAGVAFPRRTDIAEMVRAQRSLGRMVDAAEIERTYLHAKITILEVSRTQGVRSHSLQHLIEAATNSDLG